MVKQLGPYFTETYNLQNVNNHLQNVCRKDTESKVKE